MLPVERCKPSHQTRKGAGSADFAADKPAKDLLLEAYPDPAGPPLDSPKGMGREFSRGTRHSGEITTEHVARSSRNDGRNYLGMAGGIIPESGATSRGIGTSA
jgi:hypothetical protein